MRLRTRGAGAAVRPVPGLRWRAWVAAVAVVGLVAAGCSDGDGDDGGLATGTSAPQATESPQGPAVPAPGAPPRPDAGPVDPRAGELVAAERRDAPDVPAGALAWDISYLTPGVGGDLVPVTGVVFAPDAEGDGERPVVSWAPGTTGVADVCAPSAGRTRVHALGAMLDAGYVVVTTDYEGRGTPEVHPYLVGASAGRDVLDAARAARQLEGAGAGQSTATLVYGHSQGGHAALFAAELAPSYAPELDVAGVVAAAPPIDLEAFVADAADAPFAFGFFVSAAVGYAAAYPELELDDVLTPYGVEVAGVVDVVCIGVVVGAFASEPVDAFLAADPLEVPRWRDRIAENVPTVGDEAVPTLVVQGGRDVLVSAERTDAGVEALCGQGALIDLRRYPEADHGSVLDVAEDEVLEWFADRLDGEPAPSSC